MKLVKLCRKVEIPDNQCKRFVLPNGEIILLWRRGNRFYATEPTCPHAGGNLEIGKIKKEVISCPWHGWKFRLVDGKCLTEPHAALKVYSVEVLNEEIFIRLN